jgi:hypothetical protein
MALANDIVVRLYLNGDWRDVSSHVRYEDGISYSRGRRGEDDTTPPAACSLTLDNGEDKGDGDYTEQNPMGTYYGHLGRFTPAEVKLRHVRDTATTTASNGWGTTDTHPRGAWNVETWTTSGTAADFSKSGGKANATVTAAGQVKVGYLASYRARDVGVSLTWSSTLTNVTGTTLASGVCPANVLLRGQGALSSYYMLRMVVQTDETIVVDWWDQTNTSITGGFADTGVTYVAGTSYRLRVEIEGRTLRMKLWVAGTSEPFGWTDEFTDEGDDKDSPPALADVQGWVGIRSSHTGTNTNGSTTYSYDDIEVYSFVAAGEVSEWPQAQDTTGQDQTVRVTINGPRGRLTTAKTIARSSLYQQVLITYYGGFSPVPDAYFPLEDGPQTVTDTIRSAVGGNSHLRFEVQPAPANTTVGTVEWGAEKTLPGTKQAPTVKGGGALFATILPPTSAVDWGFAFAAKLNYADGFLMSASSSPNAGVDPMYWRIRMSPGSTVVEVDLLRTGAVVVPMMTYDLGSKEAVEGWHTFILEAADVGADVAYFLFVDGVQEDIYTDTGGTLQGVAYVNLGTVDNATNGISYAHLAVWGDLILSVDTEAYHNAALGSPGEWPVYRAGRLAEEYGYGYGWIGFGGVTGYTPDAALPGDGKPMGAQRVTNLLDLFNDCEKLDSGILYEQRSIPGFQFRTLASMSGRSSWITFDVATSKHLSILEPIPDDRELCNRFTARRTDGGEYIYSLDSGPMSTLPPNEGGVGVVDRSDTFNAVNESALPDLARHRVARGTIQQERYPSVVVELHRSAVYDTSGLVSKLHDLDIGDQVTLSGLTSWRVYDNRDVLVIGITGQLDQFRHTKNLATVPAELTRVLRLSASVAASTEASRLGSGYTTLDEDLTTTETDVTIEVEANRSFWVNSVSHSNRFPFDVICGGEVMRVTAGTAPAGQNQTWTVTRSINGVVKAHSAGARIDLFRKNYLGL